MTWRILDLMCGGGGASRGYWDAGMWVEGVDIEPHPNYPFAFYEGDAFTVGRDLLMSGRYHAAHVSAPCQAFTKGQRLRGNEHPDLIGPAREMLQASGLPYVIENVVGAPLADTATLLCGSMFPPLRVYRHRLFETNFPLPQPPHPPHTAPQAKMGRPPQDGEFMHVVGNYSGAREAEEAMGIDWMNRDEMREAIPPAYTRYVAGWLCRHLREQAQHG